LKRDNQASITVSAPILAPLYPAMMGSRIANGAAEGGGGTSTPHHQQKLAC
jgi:hypothetical protein